MSRIERGDSYVGGILPAVIVYGLGLAATVAPITATVLAAADQRHAGVASGVNNAVARTAQLAAVAALPVVVGLSGNDLEDPAALADGFQTAMVLTAAIAAGGGVLAFATISDDLLERAGGSARREGAEREAQEPQLSHCAVAGTPLRASGGGGARG
jgi:hypothetical protein